MFVTINREPAMESFAHRFADATPLGSVIGLEGNLGAGKTTFARYFLRAKGFFGHVKSPTYTIVNNYACEAGDIYHFDCYRLTSSDAWRDMGAEEYCHAQAICLVEWPSRVDCIPMDVLVTIRVSEETRECELQAFTEKGRKILAALV